MPLVTTKIGWRRRFRASREAEPASLPEKFIDDAPHDARKANRSSSQDPAAPGEPDPRIAEEIRLRQISLAVRYVAAVRAR
jgi:hypothetical protein